MSIIGGKLTTYRSLAEQAVDEVGRILQRRLPACRTSDTDLPGAFGRDAARDALAQTGVVSEEGIGRLLDVYGGRAAALAALCESEPALAHALDTNGRVLAAEVAFTMRTEFAQTLTDIVFRRMMIGFDADQGRPYFDQVAALAAAETGWSPAQTQQQLEKLEAYAGSLRVE